MTMDLNFAAENQLNKAIQQLQNIRSGAVEVPGLLGCLGAPSCNHDIAEVLKGMSSSLNYLKSNWESITAAAKNSRPNVISEVQDLPRSHAAPDQLFEEIVTASMMNATAATIKRQCLESPVPLHCQKQWTAGEHSGNQIDTNHRRKVEAAELAGILDRVRSAAPGIMLHSYNNHINQEVSAKDATEIRLAYPHVFCASIGLAGAGRVEVVRVMVDAYDRAHDLDPWAVSHHQVFRRLSSLATRALSYFQRRASSWMVEGEKVLINLSQVDKAVGFPKDRESAGKSTVEGSGAMQVAGHSADGAAVTSLVDADGKCPSSLQGMILEYLLLWLTTYRDLFTRPCFITGKIMTCDPSTQYPLPPIFRDFKCSLSKLRQLASDSDSIRAYHMHAVPEEMLEWGVPSF